MTAAARTRLDTWLPVGLFIAGSLVFLGGGSRHPHVNITTMPPVGTDEYFRHFARMMIATPSWEVFHTLILLGPVLWALGAAGSSRVFSPRAAVLGDVARSALFAGAVLWALAFVLDGYVGPRYAQAMMAAGVGADAAAIATFGGNAFTMARIGTVSFALIAAAALGFGVALLVDAPPRSARAIVGGLGVVVGAWPLIATATGEFYPGPFTSVYWTITAIALGLWFLVFGATLPAVARRE